MLMCLSNGIERDASEKFSIFVVESHPRECERVEMRERERKQKKDVNKSGEHRGQHEEW